MNQSLLKSFAPEARNRFRAAMEQRVALLGLSSYKEPVPAQKSGDKIYIGSKAFPAAWEDQRKKLAQRIAKQGWNAVIDEAAYTWFNRFAALRYMEVHGYMPQGMRVLTPRPQGSQPEILERAASVNLPSLKKEDILELKLDGQRDEELYRLLVLALCESFHTQLPLLFPAVQEDLELLLPDMLLRSDSLLSWFVQGMPDEEWQEIEVLGWLYQYYISELKAEYMARKSAYKKEEIPAVTQLFTPKWIVQYLVHNSLGRTWLLHNPESALKAKMPYYIEPAQQEPEVEAELRRLFSGSLNPEDIKLLDPAMGSGHILVTAYEVLREIYLERGYQRQQYARLILEKNLYGLDIDLRASEIACFALIMKARADDPGILATGKGLRLNLLSFKDCSPEERADLIQSLNPAKDQRENLQAVLSLFEQGTLFGSLIQIPEHLVDTLHDLALWLEKVATGQDLLASKAAESALVFVRLAEVLGLEYDQVISNPPYVNRNNYNEAVAAFIESNYSGYGEDLFAAFLKRFMEKAEKNSSISFLTPFTWMFLSSYEMTRKDLIESCQLNSLIRPEYHSFFDSAYVPLVAISLNMAKIEQYKCAFIDLNEFKDASSQAEWAQRASRDPAAYWRYNIVTDKMKAIKGAPFAYWLSDKMRQAFIDGSPLYDIAPTKQGIKTGNNDLFLRFWNEVQFSSILMIQNSYKWVPCSKGGKFRKWFGNNEYVLLWENDGYKIKNYTNTVGRQLSRPQNTQYFFKGGITWSTITISHLSMRLLPENFAFESTGSICATSNLAEAYYLLPVLNSKIVNKLILGIAPTLNYGEGAIGKLPIIEVEGAASHSLVLIGKSDWDAFETSWDFQSLPWLPKTLPTNLKDTSIPAPDPHSIASCWETWRAVGQHWTAEMLRQEEENNRLFIDAYGLQDELTPDVPIEQITLTVNPWYRYKPRKIKKEAAEDDGPGIEVEILGAGDSPDQDWSEEPGAAGTAAGPHIYPEGEARMRADGARELVSYALGCAMGRYSLDEGGLVYAEAGGVGFDGARYRSFPADDDGIVPVTDFKWFEEDAAVRVENFVHTVWGSERHEENMRWLAEALEAKGTELPLDTLRRYLAGDFYKDHLQTYKKRPIYWKFSSGKEKAFEALVYLHRYNAGTLSRMRMQYVVPLTGQLRKKIDSLDAQTQEAASTAERKRLEKEQVALQKKLVELARFDEELNHYAQLQIELDLDDGVRVNYGKFGGLLANVKDVCGKVED